MMSTSSSEADVLQRWERLARHLAGRYARIADREDLEQVARIAVLQAARRFDPTRGYTFPTFAVPTIDGMLRRFLREEAGARGIPRRWFDLRPRLRGTQESMARRLGREPTLEELATELGVSEEDARGALAARDLCYPASLDDPIAPAEGDASLTLSDGVGDFDALLQDVETRVSVRSALDMLPDRLREVLRQRYLEGRTQRQVGRRLGMSQMQVSRLEREALRLLRRQIADLL